MTDFEFDMTIAAASGFALAAHAGQKRKYTGEDYYHHPKRVAEILDQHGHKDLVTLQAALLHDTVEDTHITHEQIIEYFGNDVAVLVGWLTKTEWEAPAPSRAERKAFEIARLKDAPAVVKTIKLADRCDNLPSVIEHDPKFAPVIVAETRELLDGALVGGCPVLWAKLDAIVREFQQQNACGAA
jgi:(p)ppGpp synthase/HD superfamily hydrolase